MLPAKRLAGLQESLIREMTRLAYRYDAINMSQGYPDFPAPAPVKQAAVDAILADHNQYTITWGYPPLRMAIADKMQRRYGLTADPDRHICVTCGVTEAITAALLAVINPGDEVMIIEPFHENFVAAVTFAAGRPVPLPLQPPDYALDPERLRALWTPRTRAVLINTPHNPSGRVFTRQELMAVSALCQAHDAIAITDEIYEHMVYDGREHTPLATLPGMAERTITCAGFSKTFAITGWRLGYVVATNDLLSQAVRTVHDYTTICAPTPLQHAAVAALALPDVYHQDLTRAYQERRNLWLTTLADVGLQAVSPQGAYYVLADFSQLGFSGDPQADFSAGLPLDYQFSEWLTREIGIAVVPGSSFYLTPGLGRNSVRFAFPKRLETLLKARHRLLALPGRVPINGRERRK
jgi:aminotransferase